MKCCRIDFDKAGDPVKCPKRARIIVNGPSVFVGFCNRRHMAGSINPSRAQMDARKLAQVQREIREKNYRAKYGGTR